MGSFFLVSGENPLAVERIHRRGVSVARELGFDGARSLSTAWARVTTFPRGNGTRSDGARQNGRFLVAAGTWTHPSCDDAAELLRSRDWSRLDGFFSIASGDSSTRQITVVTDPLGRRQVFVRRFEGAFAVATSSMLLAALGPATLDATAVQELVHTGVLYEERTLHREVRKLPPASIVSFTPDGRASAREYWGVRDVPVDSLDGEEAVDALDASLVHGLERISAKHPRIVSDLTGGYDSRAVLCGLLNAGVGFETTVCGSPTDPDVVVAQSVARALGIRHSAARPEPPHDAKALRRSLLLCDGEYDAVEYGVVAANHERLSGTFDVSVNGSAGEIARGRWWEHLFPRAGARAAIDARHVALARFAPRNVPRLFRREVAIDVATHFTGVVERAVAGLGDLPNTTQMCWVYLAIRMRSWQGRIASSTDRIWPVVSPFLTRDVMTTALSMTMRVRRRSYVVRRMIAKTQPALGIVPLIKGYPPVPFGLRTAHRFAPLATYYGRRVAKTVGARAGLVQPPRGWTAPVSLPARLHLWLDEEVRGMLDPRAMALAPMLEPAMLRELLEESHHRDFRFEGEWARLLTVEYGQRVLREARSRAREDVELPRAPTTADAFAEERGAQ